MKTRHLIHFWRLLIALALSLPALAAAKPFDTVKTRPPDFVDISQVIPGIALDIRYHGPHNFVGAPIRGYQAPKCLLTQTAAQALSGVQADLKPFGLGLKIYDCYRPQRAVDHFIDWSNDHKDIKTKAEFYPDLDKKDLFDRGFVAYKSSHTRGSTVDLTIVPLPTPDQSQWRPGDALEACHEPAGRRFNDNSIDMGTGFDCFSELSHTASPAVAPKARTNRLLLKALMEKHGFENFHKEWWHFTLKNEPYEDTYFDFEVK